MATSAIKKNDFNPSGLRHYTKLNNSLITLSAGATSGQLTASGYNYLEFMFFTAGGYRQDTITSFGSVSVLCLTNNGYVGVLAVTLSNNKLTIKNNTSVEVSLNVFGVKEL